MTAIATRTLLAALLATLMTVLAGPSHAATTVVEAGAGGQNVFAPASVTITVGDTVEWRNTQGFHNVHAADGSFSSGAVDNSAWVYRHTFKTPGTFSYTCQAHRGMDGTVTVQAAASPPATVAPSPTATTPATPGPTAPAPTTPAPTVSQPTTEPGGTDDPTEPETIEPSPTVSAVASPTELPSDPESSPSPEPVATPLPSPTQVVAAADRDPSSAGGVALFIGIVMALLLAGAGAMLWARRRARA